MSARLTPPATSSSIDALLPDAPYRSSLSPEAEFVLLGARTVLTGARAQRFDELLERGQPFPGGERRSSPACDTTPLRWELVLFLCAVHRVTGLVGRQLSARSWKNVPPDVVAAVSYYFGAMALHSKALSGELARVTSHLEAAGVPVVSFKGPTLALALYGNGVVRPSSDIDLLVPREEIRRAHELLRGLGYAHEVQLSPSQEREHLRRDSVFNLLRPAPEEISALFPQGFAVELHWAITSPCLPFGFSFGSVRDGLRPLGGRGELAAGSSLAPADLLLILAVHGAKHLWDRLLWLCDVAQLLERHPDLDWEALLAAARSREIERMMALCLALTRDVMGTVLPEAVESWLSTQPHALRLASRLRASILWHDPEDAGWSRALESLDAEEAPPLWGANQLLSQAIDRPWKRVGFFWHLATTPTAKERAGVALPSHWQALWWVLQPANALRRRWERR